ncbi:GumC family protein, partial [Rhodosalinus sp. FB01]|uniref:GumC family protein n=1 Tax=Rhodosalinus sp. FB01 TaxID=3239194 RepID=UPI003523A18B
LDEMSPDQIVEAMRARTSLNVSSGRNAATLMTIGFEAPEARTAAAVLGEYLTLIQREDATFRRGSAGETLDFFEQQVADLSREADQKSAEILEFKNANSGALPETLDYRLSQQSTLQERLSQIERDIAALTDQRDRLITLFETTGRVEAAAGRPPSREEQRLDELEQELDAALAVYSESAPRVQLLRTRIARLEEQIAARAAAQETEEETEESAAAAARPAVLEIQLSEIDSRVAILEEQKAATAAQLAALEESIERTPTVSIRLEEMTREYQAVQQQLAIAQDRLSRARTGQLIETRSRGQKISVIEPPAVPSEPTKPNRMLIAAGGGVFGLFAGGLLVFLIEALNRSARRPEDLVKRFNIAPIGTIPFIRTRRQVILQRSVKVAMLLIILVGVPAAVYAVHTYYLPLDVIADRAMNKVGIRL